MNTMEICKDARYFAAAYVIPVFVEKNNGEPSYGTGLLIDFKGKRLVLTCYHVVNSSKDDIVYFGKESFKRIEQNKKIHEQRYDFESIDCSVFKMPDCFKPRRKKFYNASDAIIRHDIGGGIHVIVYGYPRGAKAIQEGCTQPKADENFLRFFSTTYFCITENVYDNTRLNMKQRTIRYMQDEFLNCTGKGSSKYLPTSNEKFIAQGFSGAPVFTHVSRQLVGYVTDSDNDKCLFFLPISSVLEKLLDAQKAEQIG